MSESADLEAMLDTAEDALESLDEPMDDLEDGIEDVAADMDEGELKNFLEGLEALVTVLDEIEDLLQAVDLSDLVESIDRDELLEAIELGEIPDALGEGDARDVVEFRQLFRAINLADLWGSTDLRQFWHEKGDLEDAADELDEKVDDEGTIGEAVDDATDAINDDDDGDGDDGMFDGGMGEEMKEGAVSAYGSAEDAFEDGDLSEYQVIIQQQAMSGIDEFREGLLHTHEKFQKLYEYNRERMRRTDRGTNSRNPTAASTMPVERASRGDSAKYSTVPKGVKYSTAPTRTRIYGQRFERELEKRRGEDDE